MLTDSTKLTQSFSTGFCQIYLFVVGLKSMFRIIIVKNEERKLCALEVTLKSFKLDNVLLNGCNYICIKYNVKCLTTTCKPTFLSDQTLKNPVHFIILEFSY